MRMLAKLLALMLTVAVALFTLSAIAEEAVALPAEAAAPAQPTAPAETQTPASEPSPTPVTGEAEETPSPEATDTPTDPCVTATTDAPSDPDATAEPEATLAPEEDILPDAAAGEELLPDMSNITIRVVCLNSGSVRLGDTITLSAQITGLDGFGYTLQWQYLSGGEWHDQSGANGATYSFTLTQENARYQWRVVLTIA